ncbi:hypothetical protein Pedsa_0928 [Pseudopedobacter saltans DSM 12145]|uniref:Uncharacterized protein n=1 Tax=Pseudopedobacter saltans (strain ATCC 51119 / DSM 12145 / JCM 21818 / CCUG 39354 / LMG 10337 / NBRC 100064 / NCIMB 13643) TaxID=762903 RepID=F0SAC3_PSESL|nr:DUF6364 family protein [Pseudopedobacter saltans]ADY51500.1 hypothetical protein Pedsa_0928 [Pseudopedobacter saltans DSM 12145]
MDAKITLSFDEQVIKQAKEFAQKNNISLSRLTEMIFRQITSKNYQTMDELPISDWVNMVAENRAEYTRTPSRKQIKSEFFDSKK